MPSPALDMLILTCSGCSGHFRIRRPATKGVYPMDCPLCHKHIQVMLPGRGEQAPEAPDFSQATPVVHSEVMPFGEKADVLCPHCRQARLRICPQNARSPYKCPLCKGRLVVLTQPGGKPTEIRIVGKAPAAAFLDVTHPNGTKSHFPLTSDKQIVGRADSSQPSDINIEGDASISRRSVVIERIAAGPNPYRLTVIHSANPVFLSGKPLSDGESVYLHFGDVILLGRTLLVLTPQ